MNIFERIFIIAGNSALENIKKMMFLLVIKGLYFTGNYFNGTNKYVIFLTTFSNVIKLNLLINAYVYHSEYLF